MSFIPAIIHNAVRTSIPPSLEPTDRPRLIRISINSAHLTLASTRLRTAPLTVSISPRVNESRGDERVAPVRGADVGGAAKPRGPASQRLRRWCVYSSASSHAAGDEKSRSPGAAIIGHSFESRCRHAAEVREDAPGTRDLQDISGRWGCPTPTLTGQRVCPAPPPRSSPVAAYDPARASARPDGW